MPFIDEKPAGGFLPTQDLRRDPSEGESSGLSTAASLGTVGAIGAGLYFAPVATLGAMAAGGSAALLADEKGAGAAFRTENIVGSSLVSKSLGYSGARDPEFDPWADIAGTDFEPHWERFTRARNKEHADLIRSDIEREKKDRQYLESNGALGFAQAMAAGLFDLPSLLPGGAVVRNTAKGVSRLRSAANVATFGAAGAGLTEGVLQATQQLRTPEESAMNIAGATILSGVLGYGMASKMSGAERAIIGKRIERDFTPPSQRDPVTDGLDDLELQLRAAAGDMNLFRIPGFDLEVVDAIAAPKAESDQFALRARTQTPEFRNWFKESKVVDENGEPLVVYKGMPMYDWETGRPIEEIRSKTGPWAGFFTSKPESAEKFAEAFYYLTSVDKGKGQPVGTVAAHLSMRQPFELDAGGRPAREFMIDHPFKPEKNHPELRSAIESNEYDGVIIRNTSDEGDIFVPKNPEQVKSIFNRGTFDSNDPRINYALRGFFSPAIRAAEQLNQKKGTGEQFWKQITKVPGVKKDELEWMGLEDWLVGQKSVTRDEVLSFMRAHQVELDERVLGDTIAAEKTLAETSADDVLARTKWSEDWFEGADTIWSYRVGDEQYYITKNSDPEDGAYSLFDRDGGQLEGEPNNLDQARHMLDGIYAEFQDDPGLTKFADYKVPGGENYRELLIRLPALESGQRQREMLASRRADLEAARSAGDSAAAQRLEANIAEIERQPIPDWTSPHFQEQEIVHLRVDDRTGPNGEKVLFINEVQSDLHQKGRKQGYKRSLTDVERRTLDAIDARIEELGFDESYEVNRERQSLFENRAAIVGERSVPDAPFKGDLWLELALKRALLYAAEGGYDAISWARGDQIAKAVGGDAEALSVQYDQKIGRFLSKYTRKWGGKVEGGSIASKLSDQGITAEQRQALASTQGNATASPGVTNPILSITPEMRASVMKEQPLGIRRQQDAEPIAEGKFDREKLLVTISRAALDPVGTLRHEAIHALRAVDLFSPREWKALSNAASRKGWLDIPEIRDYEKIYGKARTDETIIEEAVAMAFQRHVTGVDVQRGVIGAAFTRLKNFLERLANALQGRGLQTEQDIFNRILQGDIGARAGPETGSSVRTTAPGFTAAGAQKSAEGDIRLKGALGAEKALAFLSPAMRLQNSPAREARAWVNELAETALTYEDHKAWIPTARGGAELGQPGAVETRVKLWDANIAEGFRELDNLFMRYRKGSDSRKPGDLTVTSLRDAAAGPPQGKLDYRQFREEVSAAMRRNDEHEIPEVAEAAKFLRANVFDPLLERAVELEMLPEGVTPETAPSYLNRIYNHERIVAERSDFRNVIVKWLQENEIQNAMVRGRVSSLLDEFKTNQNKLKALGQKIERRTQRMAEMERAGEEVSRFNKFATERSIKMSEPIDEIRTEINTITAKIEEQLTRIQELSGEIRTQKENIPGLQDIERQMQVLSRALSNVRKRTEFIEQIEDAGDIEESLGELAANFQDTLVRLRGEARNLRLGLGQLDNPLPSGMTQEQMMYQASQEITGEGLRTMLEDYSQGGVVKKHFPSGEKREVLDRMADDVREILAGIETGDRPRSVRAIGNALIEADALEKLHSGPEARLFTQWVRMAARNHRIEAAAEERIPYSEASDRSQASEAGQILKALENERARLSRRIAPFRKQLRALRTDQKALERRVRPRAAEGNVYRTKIRGRGNILQDQISGRRGELESLTFEQTNRTTRQNEISTLIEEQINAYRGKSASEAQASIKRRDAAEAERTPEQRAKKSRLTGADDDVMRAARRIAAQVEKEPGEIEDLAEQIIDRILGTPEGRLPYDAHMDKKAQNGVAMDIRGPLAARDFMIPDERIEQWLENDIDLLMRAYVHTMAADTELMARFGSVDMMLQFKQINEEYARLANATNDPKERKRLHDRKKQDFLNLAAIRDRIRGTYALPEDPDALTVRAIRGMMTLNYMRMLGGMTISAIPDVSRFIHAHGVVRTFGDGIIPMFRSWAKYKKAGDEAKLLSGALEMITDNRAMRLADITDTFGRHTKFERGIQSAGRQFGMVSLMAPWNAVMKQVAGSVTQSRILRGAEQFVSGKALKQSEIEYFADLGISEGALRQIGEQFKKHGNKEAGVWSANTAEWDEGSRTAIDALRVGLRKEVDRIIVTPSHGEKPRFASTLTGAMLLQFKSFAISATQKMLIAGLQQRDLNALNAAVMAIALGGMVHILKGATSGRPVEVDWDDDQQVRQFIGNAFDRSGLAGVLMEFNNVAEKVTDGRVGLSALTGKPISRYASRNVTASLLGPAVGLAEDSIKAANAALGTREWKARDTHNARQLLPYNNLFFMRSIFDNAEAGINEAFGVPEK